MWNNAGTPRGPAPLRHFAVVWVVAVLGLCGTTAWTGVAASRANASAAETAATINMAGRQRMLSQRTTLFGASSLEAGRASARERHRQTTVSALDLFETSHAQLSRGENGEARTDLPAAAYDLYFGEAQLDERVTRHIAVLRALTDEPSAADVARFRGYVDSGTPSELLADLNRVVGAWQEAATTRSTAAKRAQQVSLASTLLAALASSGVLYFVGIGPALGVLRRRETEADHAKADAAVARTALEGLPFPFALVDESNDRAIFCSPQMSAFVNADVAPSTWCAVLEEGVELERTEWKEPPTDEDPTDEDPADEADAIERQSSATRVVLLTLRDERDARDVARELQEMKDVVGIANATAREPHLAVFRIAEVQANIDAAATGSENARRSLRRAARDADQLGASQFAAAAGEPPEGDEAFRAHARQLSAHWKALIGPLAIVERDASANVPAGEGVLELAKAAGVLRPHSRVEIETHVDPDVANYPVDAALLRVARRVVENACAHAFGPSEGRLSIRVESSPTGPVITVDDDGRGIDIRQARRDAIARGQRTEGLKLEALLALAALRTDAQERDAEDSATLAHVFRVAEEQGVAVSVTSHTGVGTCVRFAWTDASALAA